MRQEYKMSESQYHELIQQMKSTPVMKIGDYVSGMNQQERANAAWDKLGKEMGFKGETVEHIPGRHHFYFMAEPLPPLKPTVSGKS